MKFCCVCAEGVNRSQHLATVLKMYQHDAVAIGVDRAGEELRALLFKLADKIVVVEDWMLTHIPNQYASNTMVCDTGPDTYWRGLHPTLADICEQFIHSHGFEKTADTATIH